jgi:hypothetical protein
VSNRAIVFNNGETTTTTTLTDGPISTGSTVSIIDVNTSVVYEISLNGSAFSTSQVYDGSSSAPAPAPAPEPAPAPAPVPSPYIAPGPEPTPSTGILINIPIEIDAGDFATALGVQGELVTYNHVNLPLEYQTSYLDPTAAQMAAAFQWKEDNVDQTQVTVDIAEDTIAGYANGTAVVKALFKAALLGSDIRNVEMNYGIVYADDTPRNTVSDPVKFYVNKDVHTAGTTVGSTLKAYLQEYLYDNLSKAIGLAATTGEIDITLSRDGVTADEIIATALANQICSSAGTEQGVAAHALRQNIYEQMFTLAPERFQESELMRRDPAADSYYKDLPFHVNDTMAFLVTFKFPASGISAPVIQNAIRTGNSNVYVDTGDKIAVAAPTDTTTTTRPNLSDFPPCTVMLRAKLMA